MQTGRQAPYADAVDDTRTVLLTVGVEDYFHVGAFEGLIDPAQWGRFERRLRDNLARTFAFLDGLGARATFFVMGWVAERHPELVRGIVERGHEVASQGYGHARIDQMDPETFRADRQRARQAIEAATGRRVLGHRIPHFLKPSTLWALDILAEEGYGYDASVAPRGRDFVDDASRSIHEHRHSGGLRLTEVPVSSLKVGGAVLPVAGGGWFRQFPPAVADLSLRRWFAEDRGPFVMYFHIWELDPEQPRVSAGWLSRVRQYRNLSEMGDRLRAQLAGRRVIPIAEHLGLTQAALAQAAPTAEPAVASAPAPEGPRQPVSIVVPCYNESATLPFLANTLDDLEARLGARYALRYVFVDDASTDDTAARLDALFGQRPGVQVVRHPQNRGVAGAIHTGIRAADTAVVCSIDCDCTYDPLVLGEMIPKLTDGVDLVTASPYHPDGGVQNVPGWRLGLSKGASALYRGVVGGGLHTYTSCVRVYRREAVADMELADQGFLGVAELLARLVKSGRTVVEHPAVLRSRVFGHSKMKTARAIRGHLGLLARLARE